MDYLSKLFYVTKEGKNNIYEKLAFAGTRLFLPLKQEGMKQERFKREDNVVDYMREVEQFIPELK